MPYTPNKELRERFERAFMRGSDGRYYKYDDVCSLATHEDILAFIESEIARAVREECKNHFTRVNKILNIHSKSISQGGLDYVKAFEEMENYEHELSRSLSTPKDE